MEELFPTIDPEQLPARALAVGFSGLLLFLAGLVIDVILLVRMAERPPNWRRRARAMRMRPWTLQQGLAMFGILCGIQFMSLLLISILQRDHQYIAPSHLTPSFAAQSILFHGTGLALVIFFLHRNGLSWRKAFGIRPGRLKKDACLGILYYLAALPPVIVSSFLYRMFLQSIHYEAPEQAVLQILSSPGASVPLQIYLFGLAVIAAPFVEELLFRGIALPLLSRQTSLFLGVVTVSLLFAAMHFHVPSFVPLFLIGCAFSLAYVHSGSITVPIVMHALFNGVSLVALLVVRTAIPLT